MRTLFAVSILSLSASFAQPTYAASTADLRAACAKNPSHEICKNLADKKEKTKAKKAAKLDAQVRAVSGS